jgi:hypothetical protein
VLSGCTQLARLALGKARVQLQIELPSTPEATPPISPSLCELALPAVNLHDLRQLLHLAPNLKTLHLGRLEVPDEPTDLCSSWLQQVLQLMQVQGWGMFQSRPSYIHKSQPPTFSPAHHLLLSYNSICGRLAHATPLLSALAPFHNSLHHLGLHRIALQPQDVQVIVSGLPGLESLSLVRCELRGVLTALLPQLPQLQHFHFRLGVGEQDDFVRALVTTDQGKRAHASAQLSAHASMATNFLSSVHLCVEFSRRSYPSGIDVKQCLKPGWPLDGLTHVKLHDIEDDRDIQ